MQLVSELFASSKQAERIKYNFPFSKEDHHKEISESLFKLSTQTLNDCYRNLDIRKIDPAVKLLDEA